MGSGGGRKHYRVLGSPASFLLKKLRENSNPGLDITFWAALKKTLRRENNILGARRGTQSPATNYKYLFFSSEGAFKCIRREAAFFFEDPLKIGWTDSPRFPIQTLIKIPSFGYFLIRVFEVGFVGFGEIVNIWDGKKRGM